VIVILSFVLVGGFQIIGKLYMRNFIAKQTSEFEFESQQVLDQLSQMLYYRIPLSTIGYDSNDTHNFKYIGDITNEDTNYTVLEWIGFVNDAMKERNLSGFIDMDASNKDTKTIVCKDFNYSFTKYVVNNKFGIDKELNESVAIVFAGSFDRGEENVLSNGEYNNSFGWHNHEHNAIFTFNSHTSNGNDTNLILNEKPARIYEKFYLADSAYAIVRKQELKKSDWNCSDLNYDELDENDLLLFYNYRPWIKHGSESETFCADTQGYSSGNVTILAKNVTAFKVKKINSHLELKITFNKQKTDINITVSKQKVAF